MKRLNLLFLDQYKKKRIKTCNDRAISKLFYHTLEIRYFWQHKEQELGIKRNINYPMLVRKQLSQTQKKLKNALGRM